MHHQELIVCSKACGLLPTKRPLAHPSSSEQALFFNRSPRSKHTIWLVTLVSPIASACHLAFTCHLSLSPALPVQITPGNLGWGHTKLVVAPISLSLKEHIILSNTPWVLTPSLLTQFCTPNQQGCSRLKGLLQDKQKLHTAVTSCFSSLFLVMDNDTLWGNDPQTWSPRTQLQRTSKTLKTLLFRYPYSELSCVVCICK